MGGGASQKIVSLGVMIFIAPSEFHRCLKRLLPNLVSETGLGGRGEMHDYRASVALHLGPRHDYISK